MPNAHIVPSSTKAAAKLANRYARGFIAEGSTLEINNTYPRDKAQSLSNAVKDIRVKAKEHPVSWLEFDFDINTFYQSIEYSKKFSIGNCRELAELALDYIAHYVPHLDAELFHLKGGDHVFLVVGRAKGKGCYVHDPMTWGDKAYVCDPLLDIVYPAKEYLFKTKNYYMQVNSDGTKTNHLEPYNPRKHQFVPIKKFNTHYIRKFNSQEHLVKVHNLFKSKQEKIIAAALNLENVLTKLDKRLVRKYGERNPKHVILNDKINRLQALITKLRQDLSVSIDENENYKTNLAQWDKILRDSVREYTSIAEITKSERAELAKSITKKDRFMHKFFKRPPSVNVISKTRKALKESNDSLKQVMMKASTSI